MLLVGDQHVRGLGPQLGRLAASAGLRLVGFQLLGPSTTGPATAELMRAHHPALALLCGSPILLVEQAGAFIGQARAGGARPYLTFPPGLGRSDVAATIGLGAPVLRADRLGLDLGPDGKTPSVLGYAGWAGALWRWLQ